MTIESTLIRYTVTYHIRELGHCILFVTRIELFIEQIEGINTFIYIKYLCQEYHRIVVSDSVTSASNGNSKL